MSYRTGDRAVSCPAYMADPSSGGSRVLLAGPPIGCLGHPSPDPLLFSPEVWPWGAGGPPTGPTLVNTPSASIIVLAGGRAAGRVALQRDRLPSGLQIETSPLSILRCCYVWIRSLKPACVPACQGWSRRANAHRNRVVRGPGLEQQSA